MKGDLRRKLAEAVLGQAMIKEAAMSIIFAAVYERATAHYGKRGVQYVHMEVGYAGQNVHLQAESLGLGTVVVGAFSDWEVKKILKIKEEPLCIMPVGRK